MKHVITVLHLEGCAGAPGAVHAAQEAAKDVAGVVVEVVTLAEADEAAARGMRGSPTVLVDGRDVEVASTIPLGAMG